MGLIIIAPGFNRGLNERSEYKAQPIRSKKP
jgi:hypothetical protein